jgi:uncharacterized protein (TIGR02596 family)
MECILMKIKRSIARRQSGFTVIEVMTVLAVMGILAVGTLPMIQGVLDSQNIQGAAAIVRDQLQLARQDAITKNHPIQCRLYQATGGGYFAIRAVYDGTETPVSRMVSLPASTLMTSDGTYSSLTKASGVSTASDNKGTYIAFRFRADGSTDLDSTTPSYTMTVLAARNGGAISKLPSNFITLQLDPLTGKTKSFQP